MTIMLDYIEDSESDEILADVTALVTDEEIRNLSDGIHARYPVASVSTEFIYGPEPHEFRVYHLTPGAFAEHIPAA